MIITRSDRSALFTAYNLARAAARKAGDLKKIERLNKALGIMQSKAYYEKERAEYQPTQTTCNCKDWHFNYARKRAYSGPCKHMLSEALALNVQVSRQVYNVTQWTEVQQWQTS